MKVRKLFSGACCEYCAVRIAYGAYEIRNTKDVRNADCLEETGRRRIGPRSSRKELQLDRTGRHLSPLADIGPIASERGDVPHLATGADLGFAINVRGYALDV